MSLIFVLYFIFYLIKQQATRTRNMVASGTAIVTWSSAKKAITSCDIVTIASTEYIEEEASTYLARLVAVHTRTST